MKNYAKFNDEGLLETTLLEESDLEWGHANGFKPLTVENERPAVGGLQAAELVYRDTGETIVGRYEVIDNHPERIKAEIKRLKDELSAGDYKVTKCAECMLLGLGTSYDAAALHTHRETLRAQIDQLERSLSQQASATK